MSDQPEPTLEELWRRHPSSISDAQLDQLIAKLRENRRLWAAGAKPIKEPKEKKSKEPKTAKPKGPAPSLGDLGL